MAWTLEQLKHLRDLEAPVGSAEYGAVIRVIPISKGGKGQGYGSAIRWDCRLTRAGLMGPRPVTEIELEAVGVSPEDAKRWAAQTEKAVSTLNRLYPVLTQNIESRVKAIEAAVPAAITAGGA